MKKLALIIVLFPLMNFAQDSTLFVFKGNLQTFNYHLGGVAPMKDIYEPKPYLTKYMLLRM